MNTALIANLITLLFQVFILVLFVRLIRRSRREMKELQQRVEVLLALAKVRESASSAGLTAEQLARAMNEYRPLSAQQQAAEPMTSKQIAAELKRFDERFMGSKPPSEKPTEPPV